MNLCKFILFLKCIDGVGDSSIANLIISDCLKDTDFKNLNDILEWIRNHNIFFQDQNKFLKLL